MPVMATRGFYNRHASLQAAWAEPAVEWLTDAAMEIPLHLSSSRPIVIADYGCATGANSVQPLGAAIDAIRRRTPAPIELLLTDLPDNDFSTLFRTVTSDRGGLLADRPDVYPAAVGRSFYQQLLPPRSVHLAWSATTLHWLSSLPTIDCAPLSNPSTLPSLGRLVERHARADWRHFLDARTAELAPGARMVFMQPCADSEGNCADLEALELILESLLSMVAEGMVRLDSLPPVFPPRWIRQPSDFLDPVLQTSGIRLVRHEVRAGANPVEAAFTETGDVATFAKEFAAWLRAWSEDLLFEASDKGSELADECFARVEQRGRAEPHRFVFPVTCVLFEIERY